MPPAWASAMASLLSVTVSMAAETSGMPSLIVRVKRVSVLASVGKTDDAWGTSRTSSKVNASLIGITRLLKRIAGAKTLLANRAQASTPP